MHKDYDLDNINISPRIYQTWMSMVSTFVRDLTKKYPDLQPHEIGDEYFRVYSLTGVGEIRCEVRKSVCKLRVPKSEYEII